jgi:Polyketide cyclase / dehydrase and lipid transport
MKKLNIQESIVIKADSQKAWDIIGPNFLNISEWGRGINKSWKNEGAEQTFNDAPAGGRFCDVKGFGKFDERIVHYDASNKEIAWSAFGEKLPSFVTGLQNSLKVERIDDETTRISSNITANLSGIRGFLLGSIMKKNFTKLVHGFLKDWKVYTETGKVSDTKERELSKMAN